MMDCKLKSQVEVKVEEERTENEDSVSEILMG